MCGFTGIWSPEPIDRSICRQMASKIDHRGPDDFGEWYDENGNVCLGHRRLSILDLSAAGHQPMISPCDRFVLVFNGEIYNHFDLRDALDKEGGGFNWRGRSDTETLLAGLRHWGIEGCLNKLNGMFAFALWDKCKQQLVLARDRMGEKPLYYGRNGNSFLFGSELKTLTAYPRWQGEIDRNALALFMRYNHVPSPRSIYRGIRKLPPAHYVVIRDQGREVGSPQSFWSLAQVAEFGISQSRSLNLSEKTLVEQLDRLLRDAVGLRMLADVPLGAFLSGGIDSTMVVAQMQAQSSRPIKTFSIGNEDIELDEAKNAASVAKYLGTDHSELYVTAKDALLVIPKLPQVFDEPFADSSQIPTFLVSELARRDVAVVLSGDGGDELFGGYNRHVFGPGLWRSANRIPLGIRRLLGRQISVLVEGAESRYHKYLPQKFQYPGLDLKLSKLAAALEAEDGLAFYSRLRAHWKEMDVVLESSLRLPHTHLSDVDLLSQMIFQDMQTYLPDDILTKVDRASMAVSLEARVPFLDHRLIEFAWCVPSQFKVRDGKGKWLLREVLDRYVPRELIERPKQGFGVPIAQWLRGSLREWAESLLDETRMQQEGYLNAKLVRSVWQDHLAGRGNREHDLWCVLMFQSWLESQQRLLT
jgi:asparagine synthase (glutamine-hydrolysing)